MKSIKTVVIAAAIAGCAFGFAPPTHAAPMGPDVAATVQSLEAQGFNVIVNKTGDRPLADCAVSAVRPGQTYQRMESEIPGPSDRGVGIVTTTLAKTVYLDVAC
jgi:hypothetical protein